jgi:hypothetical protein
MLEAVLCFAFLTGLLELIVFAKMKPRMRLRVLGHPTLITFVAFIVNLIIHWGTMTGSMTAVTAALASVAATTIARTTWGYINGSKIKDGVIKFKDSELI